MYIIELIIRKFTKKKEEQLYNPLEESKSNEYESCEHNFMPIDSTEEVLSCIKCGFLVKKKDMKKKNFFEN